MGHEVDHLGYPVLPDPPPAAPVSAEVMLERLVALGRRNPGWWKDSAEVADLAAIAQAVPVAERTVWYWIGGRMIHPAMAERVQSLELHEKKAGRG